MPLRKKKKEEEGEGGEEEDKRKLSQFVEECSNFRPASAGPRRAEEQQ